MGNPAYAGYNRIANDSDLERAERNEAKLFHINEIKKMNLLGLLVNSNIDGKTEKDERARCVVSKLLEIAYEPCSDHETEEEKLEQAAIREINIVVIDALVEALRGKDLRLMNCRDYLIKNL